MKNSIIGLSLCFSILGCNVFFESEPDNAPEENFEVFWQEFDQLYSHFVLKNINWDSLYHVYRPQVTTNTTDQQLYAIMEAMLANLNDGHVQLISPFRSVYANLTQQSARPLNFNFENIQKNYLDNLTETGDGHLLYGTIQLDIGYLRIITFEDEDYARIDDWVSDVDEILRTFANTKGLILELRNNGGGDAYNAASLAGRFTDSKRLFAYGYSRNGPAHDDFTKPFAWYIEPEGERYTKPMIVLTNKNTASAAERFLLSMRVLPQVQVVGDTTEGAFPHAIPRALPNGWTVRLTVGVVVDADFNSYEGSGVPPDVLVRFSTIDEQNGTDPILEKAIDIIK